MNIALHRLNNQQLTQSNVQTPADLLTWFGAVQAQDYLASKWALGVRLPESTDATIERAIADRSIVRTWAMRGTLHLLAANDVRWILSLIKNRFQAAYRTHFRRIGLTDEELAKGQEAITHALLGKKQLTRPALKAALEQAGFRTHEQQLNHLLVWAAVDGLICCSCRQGNEFTYTLLDEWLPITPMPDHSDALTELTRRYFTSHGPATLADFVWWSGLTAATAKVGLEGAKTSLLQEVIAGQVYWMPSTMTALKYAVCRVHLLPSFDEYLVAYKDRSAALGSLAFSQIVSAGNGIFKPVVVVDGQVAGTWKRTLKKDAVLVETSLLIPVTKDQQRAIEKEIETYRAFLKGC